MAKANLAPELLGQPAGLVARSIGWRLLLTVLETGARLEIGAGTPDPAARAGGVAARDEDPEAVHDFRVALRRLRSWLHAFRPLLDDTVTRHSERRLRRLSRVAGPARDLQVQRAALLQLAARSNAAVAAEARRIERTLARDEARAVKTLTRSLVDALPRTAETLSLQLRRGAVPGAEPTMAFAMAVLLADRLERLELALRRLKRTARIEPAHVARIAVKRLRYLLEAFDTSSRLAASAVLRLTALQDELGRLHDAQLLSQRLVERRARLVLRARVRRNLQATLRAAHRLTRSRDVTIAREATARLIRRLELR